jgi:glyoxalase family protein
MKPLVTTGFHHITMVSGDAARTLQFYRDVLGFGLVKKTVNFDDPSAYHLYFGDAEGTPGTLLTFFEWAGLPRGRWGVGGVHHLALGVGSEEAQLKWKRRLMDAGVGVTGPYDRSYFRSIYFADPDGQILEIATAGPGYAVDEPGHALGRELLTPPGSQLRGERDEAAIAKLTHPEPVPEISADMALTGIHHISAITDDLERAGEFYESSLGLRLVKKTINRDDAKMLHYFWASYDGRTVAPHSSLTLFGWEGSTLRARGGTGQTHHIAFRAANAEEQLAWREHLLELGVQVTPVLDRSYFQSIYFQAPDGLLCEIATDGPGFAVDEPPGELGRALKLPEWLERDRVTIEQQLSELPTVPVV